MNRQQRREITSGFFNEDKIEDDFDPIALRFVGTIVSKFTQEYKHTQKDYDAFNILWGLIKTSAQGGLMAAIGATAMQQASDEQQASDTETKAAGVLMVGGGVIYTASQVKDLYRKYHLASYFQSLVGDQETCELIATSVAWQLFLRYENAIRVLKNNDAGVLQLADFFISNMLAHARSDNVKNSTTYVHEVVRELLKSAIPMSEQDERYQHRGRLKQIETIYGDNIWTIVGMLLRAPMVFFNGEKFLASSNRENFDPFKYPFQLISSDDLIHLSHQRGPYVQSKVDTFLADTDLKSLYDELPQSYKLRQIIFTHQEECKVQKLHHEFTKCKDIYRRKKIAGNRLLLAKATTDYLRMLATYQANEQKDDEGLHPILPRARESDEILIDMPAGIHAGSSTQSPSIDSVLNYEQARKCGRHDAIQITARMLSAHVECLTVKSILELQEEKDSEELSQYYRMYCNYMAIIASSVTDYIKLLKKYLNMQTAFATTTTTTAAQQLSAARVITGPNHPNNRQVPHIKPGFFAHFWEFITEICRSTVKGIKFVVGEILNPLAVFKSIDYFAEKLCEKLGLEQGCGKALLKTCVFIGVPGGAFAVCYFFGAPLIFSITTTEANIVNTLGAAVITNLLAQATAHYYEETIQEYNQLRQDQAANTSRQIALARADGTNEDLKKLQTTASTKQQTSPSRVYASIFPFGLCQDEYDDEDPEEMIRYSTP